MVSLPEATCPYQHKPCASVHSGDIKPLDMFFAYASEPQRRVDAIRGAIERIQDGSEIGCKIADWADLPIEGKVIFCTICEAIRNAKCVATDITDLNFNVLFELGFAIGAGRAIWPLVESSDSEENRLYRAFDTLTTIGHSRYTNSKSIATKLLKKKPWTRRAHLPIPSLMAGKPTRTARQILYLRGPAEDEASLRVEEVLDNSGLSVIRDDPSEVAFQPISWYLSKLETSFAVLIELGEQTGHRGSLHMAKCALVAGLSVACGRRLLVLGGDIDAGPIDYRDLLRGYKNAADAATITGQWLAPLPGELQELEQVARSDISSAPRHSVPLIKRIDVGDYVAENELSELADYFIETAEFQDALAGTFKVFVGRKGTGKSAVTHMAADRIRENKSNLVRVVAPKGYELTQILKLVSEFDLSTRNRFVEALWKYLLSTEALIAIWEDLEDKPLEASWSPAEVKVRDWVRASPDAMSMSFAGRIIQVLQSQRQSVDENGQVSESTIVGRLHSAEIQNLRDVICGYLSSEHRELTLLLDDMVPAWDSVEQRGELSALLLSMVTASRDLWRDWEYRMARAGGRAPALLLFLRSDIFASMLQESDEPDKVDHRPVYWEDADALLNLLNKRIEASLSEDIDEVLNWKDLLEPEFTYDAMKKMIAGSILGRPRDIIYYFGRVLFNANRREATSLAKRDFDAALRDYSEYALQALSAEWSPYIPNLGDSLLEFWGVTEDITNEELQTRLISSGVEPHDVEGAVRFLVDTQFLGLAIDEHNYRFASTPTESTTMMRQAGRFIHDRGGQRKFRIHRAFQQSLGLSSRQRARAS